MSKVKNAANNVIEFNRARNHLELKRATQCYSSFFTSLDSNQLINETHLTIQSLEQNVLNKDSIARSKALLSELKLRYSVNQNSQKYNPIKNLEHAILPKIERLISFL